MSLIVSYRKNCQYDIRNWIVSNTRSLGLYYFLIKDLNYFKKHGIPHVTPLPIVGNLGPTIIRRQSVAELVKSTYDLKYIAQFCEIKSLIFKYFTAIK